MSTLPRQSQIEKARHMVVERIRSLACADQYSVIEHKSGNIESKFVEELAKTGLAIVVGIETAKESESQSIRIEWEPVKLFIHVGESELHDISTTGTPVPGAWAYAEEVVAQLKMVELAGNVLVQIDPEPLKELQAAQEGNLIVGFSVSVHIGGNTRSTSN